MMMMTTRRPNPSSPSRRSGAVSQQRKHKKKKSKRGFSGLDVPTIVILLPLASLLGLLLLHQGPIRANLQMMRMANNDDDSARHHRRQEQEGRFQTALRESKATLKTRPPRNQKLDTKETRQAAPPPAQGAASRTTTTTTTTTHRLKVLPSAQGTTNRLPTPVLVLSLPKSGTTTTQRYFNCAKRKSASHHWSTTPNSTTLIKHGECLGANVAAGRPLLENCGDFEVWTDLGSLYGNQRKHEQCFFPALHGGLENIAQYYPNATIMLVVRNANAWYRSAVEWNHGHFLQRVSAACQGFPPTTATERDWVAWYEQYTAQIRSFVDAQNAAHTTNLTYVEVSLESPETAVVLEQRTGIAAQCWGICKPYPQDKLKVRRCIFPLLNETSW